MVYSTWIAELEDFQVPLGLYAVHKIQNHNLYHFSQTTVSQLQSSYTSPLAYQLYKSNPSALSPSS